jgi:hypothetical protein
MVFSATYISVILLCVIISVPASSVVDHGF